MRTIAVATPVLGILALLSACTGGRVDPLSASPRADEQGLSLTIENFATFAQELPMARALLHSQDGSTVLADIDLHQTGGVAKFGPQEYASTHFSLVVGNEDGMSVALSFNHLPVKSYVLSAPGYLAAQVNIDVEVDASAMPGGAHQAGVFGFDHSSHRGWSSEAQSRWSFEHLSAAPQPGRIFAWSANQEGDEVLSGEYREDRLEEAGRYTVVADSVVEPIMIDDLEADTEVSGALILADQDSGLWDSVHTDTPRQMLKLAVASTGAEVDLYARRPSRSEDFVWLTQEARQTAPDRYSPQFWEVELEFDGFEPEGFRQPFRYTTDEPALLASSCTFIPASTPTDEVEFNVWCIAAPATSGELQLPAMPEDLASKFDRNKVNSLEDGFEITRFARLHDYADWMDWWLDGASHTPLWASFKRLENNGDSTSGSSICVTILPNIPVCIPLPETDELPTAPSPRPPSLLGLPLHKLGS